MNTISERQRLMILRLLARRGHDVYALDPQRNPLGLVWPDGTDVRRSIAYLTDEDANYALRRLNAPPLLICRIRDDGTVAWSDDEEQAIPVLAEMIGARVAGVTMAWATGTETLSIEKAAKQLGVEIATIDERSSSYDPCGCQGGPGPFDDDLRLTDEEWEQEWRDEVAYEQHLEEEAELDREAARNATSRGCKGCGSTDPDHCGHCHGDFRTDHRCSVVGDYI